MSFGHIENICEIDYDISRKEADKSMDKEEMSYFAEYPVFSVFRDFLSIDTQNPPGNEKKAIEFLADRLHKKDICGRLDTKIFFHSPTRASIVFRVPGQIRENAIAFLGHVDTVPSGNPEEWRYPPINGTLVDGKWVYGRGATDMKSGDVAILMLLECLLDNAVQLKRDVYFVFSADEEADCMGISEIHHSGILDNVAEVIVAEPTDNRIGYHEKGTIWVEVKAMGKQAHGALPLVGINPIEYLSEFIMKLKKLQPEGRISIATTMFHSGFKENVIPADAKAILDIRTEDVEIHRKVLKDIERLEKEMNSRYGVQIQHMILQERIPLCMDTSHTMIQRLAEGIHQLGGNVEYKRIPFYTDLALLLKEKQCAFAILGPGESEGLHIVNEKVELKKIEEAANIYWLFLQQNII